ncbi:hypothetical protein GBAR_LOCUS18484, partial [Geodia barretti]
HIHFETLWFSLFCFSLLFHSQKHIHLLWFALRFSGILFPLPPHLNFALVLRNLLCVFQNCLLPLHYLMQQKTFLAPLFVLFALIILCIFDYFFPYLFVGLYFHFLLHVRVFLLVSYLFLVQNASLLFSLYVESFSVFLTVSQIHLPPHLNLALVHSLLSGFDPPLHAFLSL